MSKIHISPNALGTGSVTIASPNTNSDYEMTLPGYAGELLATFGGANGAVLLPQGTTAQRPVLGAGERAIRFNTTLGEYERGEGTGNTWERMDSVLTNATVSAIGATVVDVAFPSWAKTMTLQCATLGCAISSNLVCRIVTSAGEVATGYVSAFDYGTGQGTAASGFSSYLGGVFPARAYSGDLVFSRLTSNHTVHTGVGLAAAGLVSQSAGVIWHTNPVLSIRIYPTSAGTFTGGSVGVAYSK